MKKFSILIALLLLNLSSSTFAATTKNEWLLEQSYSEIGEHKIYVSPDAVRIVCPKQGFSVIAKAPNWDAYCFRNDNKKLWVGKFNTFTGDLLLNPFAVPKYSFEPLRPDKEVKYDGIDCSTYLSDKEGSVVYGSKTMAVAPMTCEFLCRYFNIPKMHEVPLFRRIEPSSRKVVPKAGADKAWLGDTAIKEQPSKTRIVLSTSSIKKIGYKSSDFELPKDYRLAKDAGDIGVTGAQRSQIGAALDELGFSSDYVRNEKKDK
ncbi:MAG: hypothetical protein P4L53_15490 [Candidatus Obscuribacterales bacterium]|nr:hypothetical protein [Candidatus Obscuribacterales bacterium]